MSFRDKWLSAVKEKDSVLCAGLDPAVFEMGRGEKGLPEGTDKLQWTLDYIKSVAPYCAAVKPNINYFKGPGDAEILREVFNLAHERGMVVIEDSKLPDIGSTNDAGMFYAAQRADAVTLAPFAGNIEEAVEQAHSRDLGLISMCLMSNPEYEGEKNKLVEVPEREVGSLYPAHTPKIATMNGQDLGSMVPQYLWLAGNAKKYRIDAIVIGAPSDTNHIADHEIARIRETVGDNMLVLLPGVGAQGGEAGKIWEHFSPKNVIVNVGRSLMFPKDNDHTYTARRYRDMLNELRDVA